MKDVFVIGDLILEDEKFWIYFFSKNYPNGYYEENDIELSEYIFANYELSLKWVNEFTKYYDGVLDEQDGYVNTPRVIKVNLSDDNNLIVEFYPGDTIFFLNNKKIGCTGPHYEIHKISWSEFNKLLYNVDDREVKFLLLLPMVFIKKEEVEEMEKVITNLITKTPFNMKITI